MLVSNFSIGFNYSFSSGVNRWTAGYALQMTNLAAQKIEFAIETRVTQYSFGGTGPEETVAQKLNHLLHGTWKKDAFNYWKEDRWVIEPHGARVFHLQPYMFQDKKWTPYVEGYVSLRVPVVRSQTPPYTLVRQASAPVPVLLSAWREDRIEYDQPGPDLLSTSQSSIPLASGRAHNEIDPDTEVYLHPLDVPSYVKDIVKTGMAKSVAGALAIASEDAVQALVDLLSQLPDRPESIAALNELLRDAEARVQVRPLDATPHTT